MTEVEPQFMEAPVQTSALEIRKAFMPLQEGAWNSGDLKVTPGAGLDINVAAGSGLVQGDNVVDEGLYRILNDGVVNSNAFGLGGIGANGSGNPRIDQIIARVYNHEHDGSGLRRWRLEVLAGNPTAGATLDNRNGAANLPNTAMRLADVLVTPGATTIPVGNVRDRRASARGLNSVLTRTTNAVGAANYSIQSGTDQGIDTTNFQSRVELSGNGRVNMKLMGFAEGGSGITLAFLVIVNGVVKVEQFAGTGYRSGVLMEQNLSLAELGLAPGSHIFTPGWRGGAGAPSYLYTGATRHATWKVQEDLAPTIS